MRVRTLSLATLACLGLLAADSCPPQTIQETKLLPSDGAAEDFGSSVSVSGDVAVIGAANSAYVYRFDGATWVEETKLLPWNEAPGDVFGRSVSVSGDVAVIGALQAAYFYRFDGTDWIEEARFYGPPDYGVAVSVSGDVAMIGAPGMDGVFVYRFDGTDWVSEAVLWEDEYSFGGSVSVSGDVAVIGAWKNGSLTNSYREPGAVSFHRFNGTTWVREADFFGNAENQHFGYSVSISGDAALVGTAATGTSSYPIRRNYCFVYRFNGWSWMEEGLLDERDELSAYDTCRVSLDGNLALVTVLPDNRHHGYVGAASVYRFDGRSWMEEARLIPSGGVSANLFGFPVSVSGDVALIGSVGGRAYAFSNLESTPACSDGVDNDGDELADLDDPGCAVALDTSEHSSSVQCDDGRDNDNDGKVDYPNDPACFSPTGNLEGPQCEDGIDNDNDSLVDYPEDPGCQSAWSNLENPACQDGADNDDDGLIDFDGGLSVLGYVAAESDGHCLGAPYRDCEAAYCGCGLGWELGPVLATLLWLYRRRRCSRD